MAHSFWLLFWPNKWSSPPPFLLAFGETYLVKYFGYFISHTIKNWLKNTITLARNSLKVTLTDTSHTRSEDEYETCSKCDIGSVQCVDHQWWERGCHRRREEKGHFYQDAPSCCFQPTGSLAGVWCLCPLVQAHTTHRLVSIAILTHIYAISIACLHYDYWHNLAPTWN